VLYQKTYSQMLTDTKIKNTKPASKRISLSDSNGLVLFVEPHGSKLWRYRYRWQGKATTISLGSYPQVSLLEARSKRDDYRNLLKLGFNPSTYKNNNSQGGVTFKFAFDSWHKSQINNWSKEYAKDTRQRAETYLIKFLGNKPISEIKSRDIKTIFLDLDGRDLLDTLEKIRGISNRVFSYAVGMEWIETNPSRDIPIDIFKKKKRRHYATITNPSEIARLLNSIQNYRGSYEVRKALELAPHLFLRPGELVGLRWSEIDLDQNLIRIDSSRMKMNLDHLVPISPQVKQILLELQNVSYSDFLFPGRNRTRSITTDSLRLAIRNLGFGAEEFTTHGFRHMASTRLNEMGFRGDIIEKQLAHRERDSVRAVYNHADYLDERIKMMNDWSAYLSNLINNA